MHRLGSFNFDKLDCVYTSSFLAALYVKKFFPGARKVYSLGGDILAQELKDVGLNVLSSQEHNKCYGHGFERGAYVPFDDLVDVVVQGYDN